MYHNVMDIPKINKCRSHKLNILIPDSVNVKIKDHCVFVTGSLGVLMYKVHKSIKIQLNNFKDLEIYSNNYNTNHKALMGTTKSLINGMIIGVTLGFTKRLQLVGIGYRVSITDDVINLVVGLSHSVYYKLPIGIKAQCPNQTDIILTGINKQLVGQSAADLRAIRPPEPFKGKGIRYTDEIVRNKDSKKR